jgi:type III secretion system chaperone SycN
MNAAENTLHEFGLTLGLPAWRFSPSGAAAIEIEGMGLFCLQRLDEHMLVLLGRDWANQRHPAILQHLLVRCDPREGWEFEPLVALRGHQLLIGALLPEEDFTIPAIERILDRLHDLHESAAHLVA